MSHAVTKELQGIWATEFLWEDVKQQREISFT